MNLIAYYTLTAYIYLEIQALQVLTAYQIQVKGYNTYVSLAHKINRALCDCTVSYFRLYLTNLECFADTQQFDLELPLMREFVSAYCVVHCENNTLIECASFERAKSICDAMGFGYSVICKYWLDGQYTYDDQVYESPIPSVLIIKYDACVSSEIQNYEIAINKTPNDDFIQSLVALTKQYLTELGYRVYQSFVHKKNAKKNDYYIDSLDCYTFDRMIII